MTETPVLGLPLRPSPEEQTYPTLDHRTSRAGGVLRPGAALSQREKFSSKLDRSWHRFLFLFETSLPGTFAVGDVRSGSVKRTAAAVGEGSIAVSMIHQVLRE